MVTKSNKTKKVEKVRRRLVKIIIKVEKNIFSKKVTFRVIELSLLMKPKFVIYLSGL